MTLPDQEPLESQDRGWRWLLFPNAVAVLGSLLLAVVIYLVGRHFGIGLFVLLPIGLFGLWGRRSKG